MTLLAAKFKKRAHIWCQLIIKSDLIIGIVFNFKQTFRVNLLESVIKAVRNVRALRFGLSAGSLGSPAALLSNRCSLSCYWDRKFSNLRGCMSWLWWSTRLYLLWKVGNFAALWTTETHSTFLERSKPPLLTQFLFKILAALLMYLISIQSDLISIAFI